MRRSSSCLFLALLLCVGWLLVAHYHLEASAAPLALFGTPAPAPSVAASSPLASGPWANTPYYLDPEYEREHPWGAFFTRLAITFEEIGRMSATPSSVPSPSGQK
jgi:hypothetical protein